MRKTISLFLLLLLSLSLLTGCGLFKGEKEVLSDVKPYRIMNKYDRSMLSATRVEFLVYVENSNASTKTLKKYTDEIVEKYKDEYKGIMVSFYDVMEETSSRSYVPMAVGVWAPKGKFDEALVYHKYKDSNYSTVIKTNKKVYTPTEEELQSYAKYLSLTDKPVDERLKAMNISDDQKNDFLNKMIEIEHRYEEVVER